MDARRPAIVDAIIRARVAAHKVGEPVGDLQVRLHPTDYALLIRSVDALGCVASLDVDRVLDMPIIQNAGIPIGHPEVRRP